MFQGDYDYGDKIFSRRAFVVGGLQFFGIAILGFRLAWLQIAQGTRYKTLSDKNRINVRMLAPSRGHIVDRFGVPLAINRQSYRLLIIPEQAKEIEQTLKVLQTIIHLDEAEISSVLHNTQKVSKFIPITIKEDLEWEDVAKVEVNLPDLPGILIDVGEIRTYPYREATAHVVGYVRSASERDLDGDPILRLPGFKTGKTGIEKVYDKELRGKAGAVEVEVNVVGREIRDLRRKESEVGQRVTLTIDGELQRFTQEALSDHTSASALIMDAHTGAIYALASHPAFDPGIFVQNLSQEAWQSMLENPALPQTNKAIAGQYPPGSTFKMITGLAGLEAGVINRNTKVFCPGYYEYGKDRFHCWKVGGHGRMDIHSALEQSCDTYFYKMATDLGIDAIADMARRLGLGSKLNFELSEEKAGLVSDQNWKRTKFGEKWYPGETIVSSIGQADMRATPLQLAVMTARLVNGGYAVKPWVAGFLGNEYLGRETWNKLNISAEHLSIIVEGMNRAVNSQKGTAYASRIDEDGFQMGGKTGTAQVRRITKEQRRLGIKNKDLPWKDRHHALFVGYAPTHNPRYVCSVVVEHGVSGSAAAAPIAKKLLMQAQLRDPAITKMQPEIIESNEVLKPWPPQKPVSTNFLSTGLKEGG